MSDTDQEDPAYMVIRDGTPFVVEVGFHGRSEPEYWSRKECLEYRDRAARKSTYRRVLRKFGKVFTDLDDLEEHAGFLGRKITRPTGAPTKRSQGKELEGDRYLQWEAELQAQGWCPKKIRARVIDMENERRQKHNAPIKAGLAKRRAEGLPTDRLRKELIRPEVVDAGLINAAILRARRAKR